MYLKKAFVPGGNMVRPSSPPGKCPLCGGEREPGFTTFSVDIGTGVVVVRHVQAEICSQCGEEWIDNDTAKRLEGVVEEARKKQLDVEVLSFR
jgi:YgiT-type zinc finger domain-containing protein